MDYSEVKEWLDKLVLNYKDSIELSVLNSSVSVCVGSPGIQFYEGILIIADVMGLNTYEEKYPDSVYKYKYRFIYDGIEFFQINQERISICTDMCATSADATATPENS